MTEFDSPLTITVYFDCSTDIVYEDVVSARQDGRRLYLRCEDEEVNIVLLDRTLSIELQPHEEGVVEWDDLNY